MMKKCFSCGKQCDSDGDLCHGCRRIVCVKCSMAYEHMGANGLHGKRPRLKGSLKGKALRTFTRRPRTT